MDFIRKHWSRLSLALLYFIGGVIAVVAWINLDTDFTDTKWLNAFYKTALLIATIVFFFGMTGVTIMKSMQNSKKIVSILYMCVGGLVTVLLLVLIVVANCNDSDLVIIFGSKAIPTFYQLWVPFIVFGLHPLIKGVTRFIEAEAIPAKANVQPAAAPVAETAQEEAPKAPAKKAAK